MATKLKLKFKKFKIWDGLFTTYFNYITCTEWSLESLEYLAAQRPPGIWEIYSDWGEFFFQQIANFVHDQKDLTWKDATKNIKFNKLKKVEAIKTFIANLRGREVLKNGELLADILLDINAK